jgi:hypothetical protein
MGSNREPCWKIRVAELESQKNRRERREQKYLKIQWSKSSHF